jgi:hypothetical protein
MSSAGQPFIVVGVSGSPASAGALRWAADEAAPRGGARGAPPRAPPAAGPPAYRLRLGRAASRPVRVCCRAAVGRPAADGRGSATVRGDQERVRASPAGRAHRRGGPRPGRAGPYQPVVRGRPAGPGLRVAPGAGRPRSRAGRQRLPTSLAVPGCGGVRGRAGRLPAPAGHRDVSPAAADHRAPPGRVRPGPGLTVRSAPEARGATGAERDGSLSLARPGAADGRRDPAADPLEPLPSLMRGLRTSATGLTGRKAARRLVAYGPNELKRSSAAAGPVSWSSSWSTPWRCCWPRRRCWPG